MKRLVVFSLLVALLWATETWWLSFREPAIATSLTLAQLNGNDATAERLRQFEATQETTRTVAWFLTAVLVSCAVAPWAHRLRRHSGTTILPVALLVLLPLTGCMKPYDRPEFIEVDTSETGFLIPLEGDISQQTKFDSEGYLQQCKVASKRVQILHRWSQEGRFPTDGHWIPIARLVKVNRSPVTREWTTPPNHFAQGQIARGGNGEKSIWIESADSVGFSMGFNCTAFIAETHAAKFLYWYPSGSLSNVLDSEVRGRIQQIAAEVAAKYALDQLRSRKQEISDAVKFDVTNFFAARGVSITSVGMFGGMTYENPAIQKSIDETFIAQQLKVVAEAKFDAQRKENDRIELEATATAEKSRREAQGLADARKLAAKAEAESIREVNQASQEASHNPLLLKLKTLEIEKARVEKWDGRFPQWWLGGSGGGHGPNMLFQMPMPEVDK